MIPKGLFTHIGMIIVAVAIVFTYIKPEFIKIEEVQDEIANYKVQLAKVNEVNNRLSELVSRMDSVSASDQQRLLTYLPDEIDTLAISRDLLLISRLAGVQYLDSAYVGLDDNRKKEEDSSLVAHEFTLSVDGDYNQIKTLFALLETNDYPLDVSRLNVSSLEGGILAVEMSLVTYQYKLANTDRLSN